MKFEGKEEGRRYVNATIGNAGRVSPATRDLIRPEGKSIRISLAVEKVAVVLTNEELRIVDGIGRRRTVIVVDYGKGCRAVIAEDSTHQVAQFQRNCFVTFNVGIVSD